MVDGAVGVVKGILALAAVTALATGCEASIGTTKAVDKAEVERAAATELAAKANLPKPAITCPGDLDAEVGATLECSLVAPGDTAKVAVHIEVTRVTPEGTAEFDISVGDGPI